MRRASRWTVQVPLAGLLALGPVGARAEEPEPKVSGERGDLEERLDEVIERNRELERELGELRDEVRSDREATPPPDEATPAADGALWSRRVGAANLQLLDLSVDVLAAAGGSNARDDVIEQLQGGGHDPRQRGFTLQNVELSFQGAVDPYVTGEVHLIYFLDPEGESRFEVEEAFLQTIALPFGLDDHGFQVEGGHFFTEFGRINPRHPHAWDWMDQPFVLSRVFGEDGLRAPGVRVGWLLPLLPWHAELHGGMQQAEGETMVSFLGNDEVFEERAVGGRPFGDPRVQGLEDFTYLVRLANGFDLSETITAQLGGSALFGPNGTGRAGRTEIYGADLMLKWVPLDASRGWPFVKLEGEALYRRYRADGFFGEFDEVPDVTAPSDTLHDHGFYVQALWGFFPRWAAGVRYEHGKGHGQNLEFDGVDTFVEVPRSLDPLRSRRHRVSPLLVFHPSHFARFRLQYNYDHVQFARRDHIHSVWLGVEFLYGAHPAHDL